MSVPPKHLPRRDFVKLLSASSVAITGGIATSARSETADNSSPDSSRWISQRRLTELTLTEAVAALDSGRITAVDYATALLNQMQKEKQLNTILAQNANAVLAAARSADSARMAGTGVGPLSGIPLLFKDNINTSALPTTAGTKAFANNQPKSNAPLVQTLLDAGAILFGKANMAELSLDTTSDNYFTGPVHNPWDTTRVSGGSSGGNGAATAARIVPGGVGVDTLGSARIPPALCGVAGLRPTVGRYPGQLSSSDADAQYLNIISISHTLDTPGPIARTVADVAFLDGIISGGPIQLQPVRMRGLRLGVPSSFFQYLDPEVARITNAALQLLREQGVILVDADLPDVHNLASDSGGVIIGYELPRNIAAYAAANHFPVTFEQVANEALTPSNKAALQFWLSTPVTLNQYQEALTQRAEIRKIYRQYFEKYRVSAVLFPTVVTTAELISDAQGTANSTNLYNTQVAGTACLPGLSIPSGLTKNRLPVGLEIDGLPGSDLLLLSIGLAFEDLLKPLPSPD